MVFQTSLFTIAILLLSLHHTVAHIGVCYGRKGNNLPCPQDVVDLYVSNGIKAMRIYEPDQDTLQALQGTDIKLMLGVVNQDIPDIASDQSIADNWVETNVLPYASSINYIAVGNEIKPSDSQASSVEPAMQNIQYSLNCNNLGTQIKVSTAIDSSLITNTYPPSHSQFIDLSYITPIINFLITNDSPMLVNIQPYTAYISDTKNIKLDYALFTACGPVFIDDITGKQYQNLFDALSDAMYVAIGKVVEQTSPIDNSYTDQKRARAGPKIVHSEAEWSSKAGLHHSRKTVKNNNDQYQIMLDKLGCGGPISISDNGANVLNAKTFYTNMIKHVKKGTPLTPGQEIEVYLFAMFDENQKPGNESERHYGLFTHDGQPKYGKLDFSQ